MQMDLSQVSLLTGQLWCESRPKGRLKMSVDLKTKEGLVHYLLRLKKQKKKKAQQA